MTYKRFEDLPVWQAAMMLVERVFRLTDNRRLRIKGDLANQLERAALSISNNIAEGFERGTTPELLTFVYYARGSAGEVRSMLLLCERLPALSDLKSEISNLKSVAESISRQLRAWADSLQNSDIRGPRHLDDQERKRFEYERRSQAFLAQLKAARGGSSSSAPAPDAPAPHAKSPRAPQSVPPR